MENLRQLRLFSESRDVRLIFHTRCQQLGLPEELPVTAVVLAPARFYKKRGQKAESVVPARALLDRMRAEADVDARLAVWDSDDRIVTPV